MLSSLPQQRAGEKRMCAQPSDRSGVHSHPTGAALEQDEFVCLSFAVLSRAVPPYSGVESGTFHLEPS